MEELIKDKTPEERYQECQKQSRPVVDALLNGLKPYVYLSYVLDELRKMGPFPKPDDLNRLLQWSNELQEGFRTKEKK